MKKEKFLLFVSLLCVGCGSVNSTGSGNFPGISIINPGISSDVESQFSEEMSSSYVESNVSSEEISSDDLGSSNISEEMSSSYVESNVSSEEISEELNSSYTESFNSSSFDDPTVGSYYSSIDFSLSGNTLMEKLEKLLDDTDNTSFRYSSLFTVFAKTDVDPSNPNSGYMLSFYSGAKASQSQMNREHVWPDSRGGFLVENDPHCIRPTIVSENSSRGNSFYNENSSWDPGSLGNEKYRGIAARIIFYCAVKAYTEGLYLVDKSDDPQLSSTNSITKKKWNPTMGKLSTLLEWNLEYDIDETEVIRNDVLYEEYNHCRNPFIDNRDIACQIWGDTSESTRKVCNMN